MDTQGGHRTYLLRIRLRGIDKKILRRNACSAGQLMLAATGFETSLHREARAQPELLSILEALRCSYRWLGAPDVKRVIGTVFIT
jgi:hypothetical protein